MKIRLKKILGNLRENEPENPFAVALFFKKYISRGNLPLESPLRAELFTVHQMEQHGKNLADVHKLSSGHAPDRLLSRLADNERVITETCAALTTAIKSNRQITPAAEWMLDNFHLIEEQVHTAKRHLPKGYSRALPRLVNGHVTGSPRVYEIALETISHGDARVDLESLTRFIASYQKVTPLLLGELWAIPIMLRLALIENLRRIALSLGASRASRNLADYWADQMTQTVEKDPTNLILVIADMARSDPPMEGPFVAELARRLQGQGPALALPLTWVEQRLSQSGTTIEQLIYSEIQQQAADQVSISNSIGSLRFLGTMNWRNFVETMSVVEKTLHSDPAGLYDRMDFATRDQYRHSVEKIAKHSLLEEESVARRAIELARENADDPRRGHVGYYLIGRGLPQLEQAVSMRLTPEEKISRSVLRNPLYVYLGSIALMTAAIALTMAKRAWLGGVHGELLVFIAVLSLIGASHLAVALINWLATMLTRPRPLPRMDYASHIPQESRTLVVVPTLLTSLQGADDLAEALEVRFLANRNSHLHFCLLTDFADAPSETTPDDEILLARARGNIGALNGKYASDDEDIFFLLHRPRRWNPQEQVWMGHERKRGKLGEMNSFLRGAAPEAFSHIVGNTAILQEVKYVITLDADTQLPRDAAWRFIGTMAHPLNRPRYDEERQRVTEGYGIIQPRVAISLPGDDTSLYAQLCSGDPGIDPYTRAVSDVYQDAFGEGSFVGKGIYDVDVFEKALKDRLPENRILSHDLLEGCYARAGLLSDVQLYEEYPARYGTDVSRRHRWVRGDWQLASWLLPRVPGPGGKALKNPLSGLSRWKLFDNLRRSVVPAALVLLLALGWTALSSPWYWTGAVVGILIIPSLCAALIGLVRKPGDITLRQHLAASLYATGRHLANAAFALVSLPYEAAYHIDAILRAAWRLAVTRKKLLEWNPHGETSLTVGSPDILAAYRQMYIAPVLAVAMAVLLISIRSPSTAAAALILIMWTLSPAIVWWLSRTLPRRKPELSVKQTEFLGRVARKTWEYFETYVGSEDNWLPPDNVQEQPVSVTAHRTSPTNIGVALLANLTACDFGYIPAGKLIERTEKTLHTMSGLDRYQGHFYNWYDTRSLKPLLPLYVSAVDSGNLAGHLLTLRPGLLEVIDQYIVSPRVFEGLRDAFGILVDVVGGAVPLELRQTETDLLEALKGRVSTLADTNNYLERFIADLEKFSRGASADTIWWTNKIVRQCRETLDELSRLAPWVILPGSAIWLDKMPGLNIIPTLRELAGYELELLPSIEQRLQSADLEIEEKSWLEEIRALLPRSGEQALERIRTLELLARQAGDMSHMEYDCLYDKGSQLLAIGYNVSEGKRDAGYYDLLASEARLGNFVAIAQGKIPQESWFALGRQLTRAGGKPILLSWSGSMFEYLMPLLVMPTFEKTLLDQTYRATVRRQIEYGAQRDVPWGISESGYNMFDASQNYQYRAFGVPGLGIKRGLEDDLVVAPYASAMALMVAPEEACLNLQRLSEEGFEGKFGFYEAIDYTASRLPRGKIFTVIRSFMAHHQGMSLLSLSYLLLNRPMQRRFESDPLFQSAMLLLHEKIPRAVAYYSGSRELSILRASESDHPQSSTRFFATPNTQTPNVNLLSNGRYHVMVTNAGGSSSRWRDLAVTRWREDSTRDNWGTFCYIRDKTSNVFWSTMYQPTLTQPKKYEVIFSEGRAEFRRLDHGIDIHTEIVVSPEDDIELRRSRIVNRSRNRRAMEITSYTEIVLAPPAADSAHPAFSNLFVQTEILEKRRAIVCTRRPRSVTEQPPWMFHLMTVNGADIEETSFETDRTKFIGRGHTAAAPQALLSSSPLSGSEGSVLDPIASIRCLIVLEPGQSATVDMVSGIGDSREICLGLVEKYQDSPLADRVFELAWTHSQVILRQINASEADAQLYGQLASAIVYPDAALRADASVLIKNRRGQSGLWSYAISGDLPIVLLQIRESSNIELVRQLVQAHAYWRLKGLAVDLVIWNEDQAGYRQALQDQIMGLIAAGFESHFIDRPGGIFVRPGDQISPEDRILLESVARAIITDSKGTLSEQINRSGKEVRIPRFMPEQTPPHPTTTSLSLPKRDLVLFNGLGGFTPDGREYVITTGQGQATPAPWANVIANPHFGTVISEAGHSYTWSENSRECRLTPWHNDPVSDPGGEEFYLRDEETGQFWSPTSALGRKTSPYVTRHGFGYSVFEHIENGIQSELCVYVDVDAPVKFSVLKVRNLSGRPRRLSATGYVEWVLGDLRPKSAMHIITEIDPTTGAVFVRNHYNPDLKEQLFFFDVDDPNRTFTGDRREFIGRNGTLLHPEAMSRVRLSGKTGPGLDPCAALQVQFELADGQGHETVFRLGVAGRRHAEASLLVRRFRGAEMAQNALSGVRAHWRETLGAVQIDTPDAALNILANGWLIYQTIACRLWARSGYYQSGGAFGFRDQLQDAMALIHTRPDLLRAQLLLCAAHQFIEGDVQHWWHPPAGRGVRTKCSDDYLWLPLAACRYVAATGDRDVLNVSVPFIEGRPLNHDEDSYYDIPVRSVQEDNLYQHCVRAILRSLRFGEHGLPLIGSCDWNDGMDKVGQHGKGESVWLGFFLYDVLTCFAGTARLYGDPDFAARCESEARQLQENIEKNGWDGGWYRRAYFDDGTPLGSAGNAECQIDSLSQSWSVLSGAGNPGRSRMGMEAADRRLVRRDHKLIQLLDPPFDKSEMNPGYIRGYPPGVRENGGQYTHAAVWTAMAFAKMGEGQRAYELLKMINPVNHGLTPEDVALYKVEPYVVAADVYGVAPHMGRGGWTWYTGSSGWMYRLILESLLGLQLEADKLKFSPCLPPDWHGFKVAYRYRHTLYNITVTQTAGATDKIKVTIDGVAQQGAEIYLIDDRQTHTVEIKIQST